MIKTILMPTDGSPTARLACGVAAEIAKAVGGAVMVLGVVHPHAWGDAAAYSDVETLRAEVARTVDAQVKELEGLGVTATAITSEDEHVHEAIQRAADQYGASLIVMGTHGRSGLDRVMIGSVADRVVRHSTVPVLLVPLKES